jgi:predicted dehydrogenase
MLFDTGCHLLHSVLWLTGLKPVEVCAWVDRCGQQVDVLAGMLIRFDNGALGTLLSNGDARFFDSRIRINGTLGTLVTSAYGGRLEHYAEGELLRYPPVTMRGHSVQSDFLAAVRGRTEPASPADWSLKLCRLIDAVYASAERAEAVQVSAR